MTSVGTKIWLAVAATAVVTAGAVEALHQYRSSQRDKAGSSSSSSTPQRKLIQETNTEYSEELIQEQLARNYAFLSPEGMDKVRNQNIVIVGAGGVGSWVSTMLVRSGVVMESSLGTRIDFGDDFQPTYIVDCIDNIDTKVDLLSFCYENQLPVISSGGAACKSDPTRINISDISKTEEDPLSRSVRIRLKKKGIITSIPVVFSAEKPDPRKAQLLPLTNEEILKGEVEQLAALQNFRVRILPVLGTMPVEPIEGKNRYKIYDGILQSLAGQQSRLGYLDQRMPISLNDVSYILEEVFHDGILPKN
ncbi:hypothetical protein QCA50_016474 [Cerrena zonata]|uniref:THIF-type NAD/FAD binding fold domain-containing protein n=1 Tax=Cerrena zonata TaxID=2478898 RepID=A0AAW0FFY0_9APHY